MYNKNLGIANFCGGWLKAEINKIKLLKSGTACA
jgi:hypothetical protein